jgi:hypothetical protein
MNTGKYCWVDQGAVVQGPRLLPQNWQDPNTGQWYFNLNNEAAWSDPQLLTIGWYPYVLVDAGAPGPYYTRTLSDFQVQATEVVQTATYEQWPIEQVRETKNEEMVRQITQYRTNELAANPKVSDYVEDDAKWLTDQQAELARLDEWQDVADFDTTKPSVLILPNNYVGKRYVEDGVKLTAQNDAATSSGLEAPWDQAIVDDFITANKIAADDNSGGTVPTEPTFEIRQGVAVPSEESARIVIYRYQQENANPALQTNYKMRLLNRQDNRPLYVFSYTGITYLAWHQFEDLGGGTWGLEGHSSEWQYVPGDMAFIFSYGTNPAVEADFFTSRVEFPAGIEQQNIFVAWDQA